MKKTPLILLVFIFIASFCNAQSSQTHLTQHSHHTVSHTTHHFKTYRFVLIKQHDRFDNVTTTKIVTPRGRYNIPDTFSALGVRRLDSVIEGINTLAANGINKQSSNSFIFNAAGLKGYLDSSKSPTIQIMLASDTETNNLFLTICPLDVNGDHIYLQDTGTKICYITTSVNVPQPPPDMLSPNSNNSVINFYFGAATIDSANSWIKAYNTDISQNNNTIKKPAATWIYSSKLLSEYLSYAISSSAVNIEFKLCDISGRLSLIATGIDKNSNRIYFNFMNTNCVLENFNPCPYCAANPLEKCQ